LPRAANARQSLASAATAVVVTWVIYLMIPYFTPELPSSRISVVAMPLMALAAIGAWRLLYAGVFVRPHFEHRAIIVGAGEAGCALAQLFRSLGQCRDAESRNIGYQVVAFTDDDADKHGQFIEGFPVLGGREDLVSLCRRLRAHELVISITHLETMHPDLFEAIQKCREQGVTVTTMAEVYERVAGRVPIEHAGRVFAVAMPLQRGATHRFYLAAQRVLDMFVGIVGCLGLALIIPVVWLMNRIGSPGPLFYSQERVGKGGHPFPILKFRSMVTDAEKFSGAVWAEENDPRITPVGRFLRKTRLDEVPQFWNILRGDMSLVGPRPERPHFVNHLAKQIPFYRVRHAVRPGLTGWAQVKYRYGASEEDSLTKLQYDLYYIKHQRLLLDVEILLKTAPVVLGFKGR
jgi:exopolysaccharide biosynthesis polyprenyl glycosylphosphotransferase